MVRPGTQFNSVLGLVVKPDQLFTRIRDGAVFKVIQTGPGPSGPESSVQLQNMNSGRKHWVGDGLAGKYLALTELPEGTL